MAAKRFVPLERRSRKTLIAEVQRRRQQLRELKRLHDRENADHTITESLLKAADARIARTDEALVQERADHAETRRNLTEAGKDTNVWIEATDKARQERNGYMRAAAEAQRRAEDRQFALDALVASILKVVTTTKEKP